MKLLSLKLRNYKQYRSKTVEFQGNLIGVVGPNGKGKSNLLGAIHFALSGDDPGVKKSDLISWGSTAGDVELTFEHGGTKGTIKRSLAGTAANFEYGAEKATGIKNVDAAITKWLGVDKDLLKQSIFVRQSEIDAVLFEDPRNRELAFQKLCGLGDATKVHKRLGDFLASLGDVQNYDTQIANYTAELVTTAERVKQLQTLAYCADEKLKQLPGAQYMRTQHADALQSINYLENAVTTYKALTAAELPIQTALADQAKVAGEIAKLPQIDKPTLTGMIDALKQLDYQITQRESLSRSVDQAEAELGALVKPGAFVSPVNESSLAGMAERLVALDKDYSIAAANKALYEPLYQLMAKNATAIAECPVCGGPVKDIERLKTLTARYKEQVTVLNDTRLQTANTLNKAKDQLQAATTQHANQVTTYNIRCESLVKQVAGLKAMRDGLPVSQETRDVIAGKLAALNDLLTQNDRLTRERDTVAQKLEFSIKNKQTQMSNLADCAGKLMTKGITMPGDDQGCVALKVNLDSQAQNLVAGMTEVQNMATEVQVLNARATETQIQLSTMEKALETLKVKQSQQTGAIAAKTVLSNVRDWFHYANGPHTLCANILKLLTAGVNKYLGQFNSPFSVTPAAEGIGFNCIFHDGRVMPAEGFVDAKVLSGGERIRLAISFRLASYQMFAGKLGVLSLDEPTNHMDVNSIGRFCGVLEQLKTMAKAMDLQLLIATHAQDVLPFLDTVLDLND